MPPIPSSDSRRRWGWWLVGAYLALLAVSHLARPLAAPDPLPDPAADLFVVAGQERLGRNTSVGYLDTAPGATERPAIVLLHGSPGSRRDFATVVPTLVESYRVIVPDLPGFGESRAELPDYSIRAHADYVEQLLDHCGIARAHVVGFSMGGGVALELYNRAPQRVASLTLLASIGVQELELFGNYTINHGVHGAQLIALWLAHEALPHMGLFDDAMLSVAYARNFFDSDQRSLRKILQSFEPPMLILHGRLDPLVPLQAAREHHRLVPQSELELLDGDHFMVFRDGPRTAARISRFVARAESGQAVDRSHATESRVAAAAGGYVPTSAARLAGIALLLMLFVIAVATLVSEDLTCIAVGLLVAHGRIEFLSGTLACFAGIYVGDLLLYLAGRWLGRPALERRPLRWFVSREQVEASSRWFSRRGAVVIGLSRFLPGTRLPTYFAAGVLRTNFWAFSLYFFLAVALWTPLLVALAMLLGDRAFATFESFQQHALPLAALLALWIFVVVKLVVPLGSHRGRRRWVGRCRRLVRWEFWPPWLFYPPVALYILFLGLRYRSPFLFTAANPAIEAGGFIAESKWDILASLSGSPESLARTERLPAVDDLEARVRTATAFMQRSGLDYPIVLKPDAGQRGSGVAIVRSPEALRHYLNAARYDTLIQEYVGGDEFGIFYYRLPGAARGEILSITEKKMPELLGDGERTLGRLILDDPRAVCLAEHYTTVAGAAAERVPARGESVRLVELGTHCRGAVFLDGAERSTEALRSRIDEISRGFDGFFFGRYDLKVADSKLLSLGQGFKIIELNGVTSEATHIYDPRNSLGYAYRTLFRQWRLAFEIGDRNRRRGHEPAGAGELLALLRRYRLSSASHSAGCENQLSAAD